MYAYRVSKAGVNMMAKNFSCDLKEKGIAVVALNPGMIQTHFGPGPEQLAKMGAATCSECPGSLARHPSLLKPARGRPLRPGGRPRPLGRQPWSSATLPYGCAKDDPTAALLLAVQARWSIS